MLSSWGDGGTAMTSVKKMSKKKRASRVVKSNRSSAARKAAAKKATQVRTKEPIDFVGAVRHK